jgi:two-component system, OmpR family, sensor histidine kinase MprB
MSFRRRIILASALAVAVAIVLASLLVYLLTSRELHGQIDAQLRARTTEAAEHTRSERLRGIAGLGALNGPVTSGQGGRFGSPPNPLASLPRRPDQTFGYFQTIDSHGVVQFASDPALRLPVSAAARRLAARSGRPVIFEGHAQHIDLRILAGSLGGGRAIEVALPLTDTEHLLSRLRLILVLIDAAGVALAALLGLLVAGTAMAPIRRLTQTTEHVARTQDLSLRIRPGGGDELGRLAVSFNAMLDALEGSMRALDTSVRAQRQLVADASHELRTPITSVRTNIEILQQSADMDADAREHLLSDVVEQIEELTLLMNDLIDLARGDEAGEGSEDVRLDLTVADALARAQRRSPTTRFEVGELQPTIVIGAPARLDRAVSNLIDNAVKYAPNAPIAVSLRDGELRVRDHGPGIAEHDLPQVFDRFYRGAEARGRPGSGLGLAIVRQVAESHGGSVSAERASGGGALLRLRLPTAGAVEPDTPDGRPAQATRPGAIA